MAIRINKKKKTATEKEYLKANRECLKLSKYYKDYCNFSRGGKKKNKPVEAEWIKTVKRYFNLRKKGEIKWERVGDYKVDVPYGMTIKVSKWKQVKEGKKILKYPESYKIEDVDNVKILYSCRSRYMVFGDVFTNSFEKWWKKYNDNISCDFPIKIDDYGQEIKSDMESCISSLQKKLKRMPTTQEFMEIFLHELKWSSCSYLKVNLSPKFHTADRYLESIKKQMAKYTENRWGFKDGSRKRIFEVAEYLKIYRLHDKEHDNLGWPEIYEKLNPDSDKRDYINRKRSYQKHYKKADSIIKNMESGLGFPKY